MKKPNKLLTPEQIEDARALFRRNWLLKDVAAFFDVSTNQMRRHQPHSLRRRSIRVR